MISCTPVLSVPVQFTVAVPFFKASANEVKSLKSAAFMSDFMLCMMLFIVS